MGLSWMVLQGWKQSTVGLPLGFGRPTEYSGAEGCCRLPKELFWLSLAIARRSQVSEVLVSLAL